MFRTSAVQSGAYLALANLLHIPCAFLSGAAEAALTSHFETLPIRIGMTVFSSVVMGLSAVLFGVASTARQATVAQCLFVLGQSGNNGGIVSNL